MIQREPLTDFWVGVVLGAAAGLAVGALLTIPLERNR